MEPKFKSKFESFNNGPEPEKDEGGFHGWNCMTKFGWVIDGLRSLNKNHMEINTCTHYANSKQVISVQDLQLFPFH